jgi:hypothetical protein
VNRSAQDAGTLDQYPKRYNAACAALRAFDGKGADAAGLDEQTRTTFRQQALRWLGADLLHEVR